MNGLWKLLLFGAGAYALLVAFVYFTQASLLYYPNVAGRALVATPADIGLAFEDADLTTADGVRLHGWFVPAPDARGTLLFFHGNAGNISHRLDSIRIFHRLGLDVFIIDYRGYGRSDGKPGEQGTYRDADAAWRYLVETRGVDPARIVVFGRSLGAAIAAYLGAVQRPGALILESPFASVESMGRRLYPFLPVRWLNRFGYETAEYVQRIACPVLVVHSRNDEIIPIAEGRAVFAAAPDPKRFLEIRGGHNDGFLVSGAAYVGGLDGFLRDSLR